MRIDDLQRCLVVAFERLELTPEDAEGLAGLLVDSELRGHPDHGVAALGVLTTFYRERKLNPRPRVHVLRETDGALLLDGDRGCGPGAPTRAMRWCIERARERPGMAVAAVRDWQLLIAAPYARLAAPTPLRTASLLGSTTPSSSTSPRPSARCRRSASQPSWAWRCRTK